MAKPELPADAAFQNDPTLQQQGETLQALLNSLTEKITQDLCAIQVTTDSLIYGFQRERSFSEERLHASLELITAACRQAAQRIENARRQFPSLGAKTLSVEEHYPPLPQN